MDMTGRYTWLVKVGTVAAALNLLCALVEQVVRLLR